MLPQSSDKLAHEQPRHTPGNDFDTVEELGRHVDRIAALLRAAVNVDPDNAGDEGWLVSMAHDEAVLAEARFEAWGLSPRNGAA